MKIFYAPHPVLRQKALKVKSVNDEELKLAKKMMHTMINVTGVGLAANQVGILKQIVTVNIIDKDKKLEKKYVLFNPKILSYSKNTVVMEEGCLSLPEQFAEIERPEGIKLEYINEKNKLISKNVSGYEARVLQHEIDHLSGKLFVDYLSSLKRNFLIKKVKKVIKNIENK